MSVGEAPERTDMGGPPEGEPESFRPVGTVTFLALYAAVLVVLWLGMYLTMLSRGATS